MLLDLHTHSIKSDDGRAKVENYCQWIKAKELPLDGFVLTEHRQFDDESDYSALAEKFGLCILKASEVETEYGHVLVYGVTPELQRAFDFTSTHLELAVVLSESKKHGAMAVPCHPGRPKVGMFAHTDELGIPEGVEIVEIHNGGSRDQEDQIAMIMPPRSITAVSPEVTHTLSVILADVQPNLAGISIRLAIWLRR